MPYLKRSSVKPVNGKVDLGPDGLRGRLTVQHLPPVGERRDEDETAAGFVERFGRAYGATGGRTQVGTGVGDLDTDAAGDEREPQLEVPPGDAAVGDGVGGEFGDDRGDVVGGGAVVRDAPGVQLVHGEVTGEAGAAWGGAEALDEHTYGDRGLGRGGCWHGPNLAGGHGTSPGGARVPCGSVRGYGVDSTCDGP